MVSSFIMSIAIGNPKMTKQNKPAKMKLSDLQPKQVDWSDADRLFYEQCPSLIAVPLQLATLIQNANIMDNPDIDENYVLSTFNKIKQDSESLVETFGSIKKSYEETKQSSKSPEDSFMAVILFSEQINNWTINYEETVIKAVNDIIDYINARLNSTNENTGENNDQQ